MISFWIMFDYYILFVTDFLCLFYVHFLIDCEVLLMYFLLHPTHWIEFSNFSCLRISVLIVES